MVKQTGGHALVHEKMVVSGVHEILTDIRERGPQRGTAAEHWLQYSMQAPPQKRCFTILCDEPSAAAVLVRARSGNLACSQRAPRGLLKHVSALLS